MSDVYKVSVVKAGSANAFVGDAVEYQGRFWLVPIWRHNPSAGWSRPARLIPLDALGFQDARSNTQMTEDFFLNTAVPTSFYEDRPISDELKEQYEIVEEPDDLALRRFLKRTAH